jgi:hypothetical protein
MSFTDLWEEIGNLKVLLDQEHKEMQKIVEDMKNHVENCYRCLNILDKEIKEINAKTINLKLPTNEKNWGITHGTKST